MKLLTVSTALDASLVSGLLELVSKGSGLISQTGLDFSGGVPPKLEPLPNPLPLPLAASSVLAPGAVGLGQ